MQYAVTQSIFLTQLRVVQVVLSQHIFCCPYRHGVLLTTLSSCPHCVHFSRDVHGGFDSTGCLLLDVYVIVYIGTHACLHGTARLTTHCWRRKGSCLVPDRCESRHGWGHPTDNPQITRYSLYTHTNVLLKKSRSILFSSSSSIAKIGRVTMRPRALITRQNMSIITFDAQTFATYCCMWG